MLMTQDTIDRLKRHARQGTFFDGLHVVEGGMTTKEATALKLLGRSQPKKPRTAVTFDVSDLLESLELV